MYQHRIGDPTVVITGHGFLVYVEAAGAVNPSDIAQRLAGALTFIEGVGPVDVDYMGEIDVVESKKEKA